MNQHERLSGQGLRLLVKKRTNMLKQMEEKVNSIRFEYDVDPLATNVGPLQETNKNPNRLNEYTGTKINLDNKKITIPFETGEMKLGWKPNGHFNI